MLGAEEVAGVVDAGDEFPVLERHLLHRTGLEHPRIGHKDIQPAEFADHLCGHGGDGFLIGDVHGDGDGAVGPESGIEFIGSGLSPLHIEVGDDDVGAIGGEFLGDAEAKALGGAGDHADAIRETGVTRTGGGDLAAVGFHFPVLDEAPFLVGEETGATEGLGQLQHEAGILGGGGGGTGVLQRGTSAVDGLAGRGQHLGLVAARLGEGGDALGGEVARIGEGLGVDDVVGREGAGRNGEGILHGDDGTLTVFGKQTAQGRGLGHDCLGIRRDLKQVGDDVGLGIDRLKRGRHATIDLLDLFERIGPHENAMVAEEEDLRLRTTLGLGCVEALLDHGRERIARVGILDPEGIREELGHSLGPIAGAGHAVDKGRVEMDHVGVLDHVVHRGLDGGAARASGLDGGGHQRLYLGLALPGALGHGFGEHALQRRAPDLDKLVLLNRGQRGAAGFDIEEFIVLEGGVATAQEHVAAFGSVFTRRGGEIGYFQHGSGPSGWEFGSIRESSHPPPRQQADERPAWPILQALAGNRARLSPKESLPLSISSAEAIPCRMPSAPPRYPMHHRALPRMGETNLQCTPDHRPLPT